MGNKVKIALVGATNSGKTTSLYYLSYRLKKKRIDLGIGHEVARECPYPLGESEGVTFQTQLWILCKQLQREAKLERLHDKILLDRSIYDSIAYCDYLQSKKIITKEDYKFTKTVALKWGKIHPYSLLIYLKPIAVEEPTFQQEIDKRFQSLLSEINWFVRVVEIGVEPIESRCRRIYRLVTETFK